MNKWLWGGLGWAIGGPIGAIMGYALGSMSSQNQNYSKTRGGDFGAAMLVLFAAVMKADATYTKQRMELFKKILQQDIDVKSVCGQINSHMDVHSKIQLVHILFGLSKADNNIHNNEIKIISDIATLIGLGQSDFNSVKAMFVEDTSSSYKILGLNQQATDAEIKLAYRNLATKFHPDKVSHLGEEFTKIAEEKFKSINDAYQKIKKERNL